MATFISPTFKGSDYVSGVPLDLVATVGMAKQQKYDTNRALIEQSLNSIDINGLLNSADKEYVSERLNNIVNEINTYAKGDLSDAKINGQIQTLLAGFKGDSEIYSRLNNNLQAKQSFQDYQKKIKDNPEKYSPANEEFFLKQFNAWKNDPDGNKPFNASYIEYQDIPKVYEELALELRKNPDSFFTAEEIQFMGAKGAANREVKQLTEERLRESFITRLKNTPALMQQAQINYEYEISRLNPTSVYESLEEKEVLFDTEIKKLKGQLNEIPSSNIDLQERIKNNIKAYKINLKTIHQNKNKLLNPNTNLKDIYTFNSYIRDFTSEEARIWAFRQEGVPKLDELSKLEFESMSRKDLEQFKAVLEQQKESFKTKTGYPYSRFLDDANVILSNGEGSLASDQSIFLFNNTSGKVTDTGGYYITVNSQNNPLFFDVAPILTVGNPSLENIESVNTKVSGYSKLKQEFKNAVDINKDFTDPKITPTWWNEEWGSFKEYTGYRIQTPDKITNVETAKTKLPKRFRGDFSDWESFLNSLSGEIGFSNWLNTEEGKIAAERIKTEFKFDYNNETDKVIVSEFDKKVDNELIAFTSTLFDNFAGTYHFIPNQGNNTITGSDGKVYVQGTVELTKQQIFDQTGVDMAAWLYNAPNKDVEKAIKLVGEDKNGNSIYQVPITIQADRTLKQAGMRYDESKSTPSEWGKSSSQYDAAYNDMYNKHTIVNHSVDYPKTEEGTGKLLKDATKKLQELQSKMTEEQFNQFSLNYVSAVNVLGNYNAEKGTWETTNSFNETEQLNARYNLINLMNTPVENIIMQNNNSSSNVRKDPRVETLSINNIKELIGENVLGFVSSNRESGKDPFAIGYFGNGDVYYGAYQIDTANLPAFMEIANSYPGLSGNFRNVSYKNKAEFQNAWKSAAKNPVLAEELAKAQYEYIYKTHYLKSIENLNSKTTDNLGTYLSNRGAAFKEMLFSIAVQYGPNSSFLKNAIDKIPNYKSLSDSELIEAIYNYKYNSMPQYFTRWDNKTIQTMRRTRAIEEKNIILNVLSADKTA